ncbi:MAG: SMP-30/gluconolactonase/LRE family protein [Acidobacteriota bacterium]|nr:SMP-30/gluconolactonase/LRE family protein [Acidobacteriota bacterium]MDH3528579.1 SMP-30/gluconolactonase/LRE family protein [Acidobacteriota bacterium]
MKFTTICSLIACLIFSAAIEADAQCRSGVFPSLSFTESSVFPADKSLKRPEDGKALPDGRIIVGDEDHGLRIIERDGKHRPFGKFKEAGFENAPPEKSAAANGIFLEKDGKHLLVADIYTGFIYRVDVKTEETSVIYRHKYGVNSILRDQQGAIWFTQSADNTIETGPMGMYAAIDKPAPTGAVFRLEKGADIAARVAYDIYFANGIAITKDGKRLFVSETMMDRVLSFEIDGYGKLINRSTYANVMTPDNLMTDSTENLYIASPISNSVYAVDAKCKSIHRVFSAPTPGNTLAQHYWAVNSRTGQPILPLLGADTFAPLPGILTGMFFSTDGKTLYVTGLGNAVLRIEQD